MNQKDMQALLDNIKVNGTEKLTQEVIESMKSYKMVVPAVLPKNTDPRIMRQMLGSKGRNMPIPKGVSPQPITLTNKSGQILLPVFTSEEEKAKDTTGSNFPLSLNISFDECMKIVSGNPTLYGIVLNPFSHNIIMQLHAEKQKETPKEMTIDQYHLFSRQRFESNVFPKHLFEQKGELIQKLVADRGACIKELYENVYDDEIANPYVEDDFDVLSLSISEELTVLQIRFPGKYIGPNICPMAIIGYDSSQEKLWYYTILSQKREEPLHLMRVLEDGKPEDLGIAPKVGSELSKVIEKIEEDQGK